MYTLFLFLLYTCVILFVYWKGVQRNEDYTKNHVDDPVVVKHNIPVCFISVKIYKKGVTHICRPTLQGVASLITYVAYRT